jgi:hypothetical protein
MTVYRIHQKPFSVLSTNGVDAIDHLPRIPLQILCAVPSTSLEASVV